MVLTLLFISTVFSPDFARARELTDSAGRVRRLPDVVQHTVCSGPGCLRLLTYLGAQDRVVAVDDIEKRRSVFDARPYALANRQFEKLPLFGEFRGRDNPELILALDPQPQVIFKTYGTTMGTDPDELEQKTGIPVVVLDYGDLGNGRDRLYRSLRIMGDALGRSERAEDVIGFMDDLISDLDERTKSIPNSERPTVFIGGVAFKGPHGFRSTEPTYPPFSFVHARNVAADKKFFGKALTHSDVAKEMIVQWDPEILILDLATLQLGKGAGGLHELRTDPAYRALSAVNDKKVYGVLPYNGYSHNYGSILSNAYFIGKLLYPERFADVDPAAKADDIFRFLVGKPVFEEMNNRFDGLVYEAVPVDQ